MKSAIINESILKLHIAEMESALEKQAENYNIDMINHSYGSEYAFFLLFSHPVIAEQILEIKLDNETAFYNSYLWLQTFVSLYNIVHGFDAGLEQRVFKMLGEADFEIDFEFIEQLDKEAVLKAKKKLC